VESNRFLLAQAGLEDGGWTLTDERSQGLMSKLKAAGVPLGEYVGGKIYRGVLTGLNEAFVIDAATRERLIAEDPKSAELIKPFVIGRQVKRYQRFDIEQFLIFMPKGWTRKQITGKANPWQWLQANYPAIAKHLWRFAKEAEQRYDKGEHWWELRACEYYAEFEKTKIIYPNICKRPEFTLDLSGVYTNQKCFIIPIEDKYLLGILNSSVSFYLFKTILPKLRGDFFEPSYLYFKDFPIPKLDISKPVEGKLHALLVDLVEAILGLQKRATSARTPYEKEMLQRQISATDEAIDKLVYELYGLTEDEIRIVEG
jgi:hypothetical protein